jgi:hypothetical protein
MFFVMLQMADDFNNKIGYRRDGRGFINLPPANTHLLKKIKRGGKGYIENEHREVITVEER